MKAERFLQKKTPDVLHQQKAPAHKAQPVARLWLCLYFPNLSLDALQLPEIETRPYVIFEEHRGQSVVLDVSANALASGVEPGMALGAASVLCPSLVPVRRKKKLEEKLLSSMAVWLGQYSSEISEVVLADVTVNTRGKKHRQSTQNALLIEVARSVRLFGGLSPLIYLVYSGISKQFSLCCQPAVAPTPVASYLLARNSEYFIGHLNAGQYEPNQYDQNQHDQSQYSRSEHGQIQDGHSDYNNVSDQSNHQRSLLIIEEIGQLRSVLGKLPIQNAGLPAKTLKQLHSIGIRFLHDLWRLPRAGLDRRFGSGLLQWMNRLLGDSQDILVSFEPGKHFESFIELNSEVDNSANLKPAFEQLLTDMIRFLRRHDAGIEAFSLCFKSERGECVYEQIQMTSETRDQERIALLLDERLSTTVLQQPVVSVGIQSGDIAPFEASTSELFGFVDSCYESRGHYESWNMLVEQLQGKLGMDSVRCLHVNEDHRPEKAWRYRRPGQQTFLKDRRVDEQMLPLVQRPIWLLSAPQRLRYQDDKLFYGSNQLFLLKGERIESGWWDGDDVRRDYYVAKDRFGSRYWVYRDLDSGRQPDSQADGQVDDKPGGKPARKFDQQPDLRLYRQTVHWFVHGIFA